MYRPVRMHDMWHFEVYCFTDQFGTGGIVVLLILYFEPTILAIIRGHLSVAAIFILNVVFGWTFIGWIIALIPGIPRA